MCDKSFYYLFICSGVTISFVNFGCALLSRSKKKKLVEKIPHGRENEIKSPFTRSWFSFKIYNVSAVSLSQLKQSLYTNQMYKWCSYSFLYTFK
jgi:hypothetical protein